MNSIQIYSNEIFSVRTTQDVDGTIWFVARDIAEALEYKESSIDSINKLMAIVPEIWTARKRFLVRSENGVLQEREMLCLTEQGVYFFLGRSDKPKALPYQMWIAGDVVPSIRETGSYSLKEDTRAIDREMKALDLERAKILQHMLDAPTAPLSEESRAVIQHEVFKIITGGQCLSMLPAVTEKYYTATELGEMFGVSSKKIGKIAKANGLQSEEGSPSQFGQWRLSKSPYSAHQCSTFVYNSNALDWFREHCGLIA